MAEIRTTSYNHVQSPKIGGCTGAFFNLFDWNPSKRFASTKRLPAERPAKSLGRSKSFRDDRSAGAKSEAVHRGFSPATKSVSEEKDRVFISEDDAGLKPPGLVARLMGLESLPEASVHSKHRRSRSFSGSESASYSEQDSRPEKLVLRDLLKQEHESFDKCLKDAIFVVPVERKKLHQEKTVRKSPVQTPIKSLVPYVDSPTGSCRSVYALPYVHKVEKSPFLARLHPSPVLQPSKCHNQMISPAKTSPATKKRASRFLEAAVKILEEISDNEQCFPMRERETGMRSIAEFAVSSPPSSGIDLLHCRSVSKIWNGNEDTDSVGSRSNRSLISRGSVSFRDSQRRDRICRDIFETSLPERALSLSPPPRRPPSKGARGSCVGPKEVKAMGILRTQEAAVGDFKTDVRKSSAGVRKSSRGEPISTSSFTDSVHYLQQSASPMRDRKNLHSRTSTISNGLGDNDAFTSDEESLTDHLSSAAAVVARESKPLEVGRSNVRRSPRKSAISSPIASVRGSSKEHAPSPQFRVRSKSVSLHDGLRPIKISRNQGDQQENAAPVSSSQVLSNEFVKSRSASSRSHSRQLSGQMDDLRLSVRIKKNAACKLEKQGRGAPELPAVPSNQCQSALKRTRRSRHGSQKFRESLGSPSVTRGGERMRGAQPNLHWERRNNDDDLEAVSSSSREGKSSNDSHISATNSLTGKDSAECLSATVRSVDIVVPELPSNVVIGLPTSRNSGDEAEMVSPVMDVNLDTIKEHREIGALVHGVEIVEQIQVPVRDLFPSPDIAECNPEELLILGTDDLHWDDEMLGQRRDTSSRARYCEIRASGESLQSIGGALDEDVCNVDDGSLPSPHQSAGECSEADVYDESATPVLMKRFLGKPLRLDVDKGETSPVSVLESPFGDEVCTTSESSIAESEQRVAKALEETETMNLTEVVAELERESNIVEVSSRSEEPSAGDKVREAILAISSFTSLDHERASECSLGSAQISPHAEKTFVREVLSAAQLLSSPGRSPNWYERDLAVDPSLFEKLEGGDSCTEDGDFLSESGGLWRCDRKLLFDCVNEAFSQNIRHFKDPQPWLRRPVLRKRSVRHKLVEEVQEKINGWRELASHAIDTLIDVDMSTRVGKWTDFSEDVAEVGAEIECMLWKVMIEEVVLDLATSLH